MRELRQLLQAVEEANKEHHLFEPGEGLVVGASGGPDSTALLVLLSKLRKKYDWKIVAAHLNHGLHKREAKKYEALVQKTAGELGFPFYAKKVDLKKLAKKHGRSIEEMGRMERYRFFQALARKTDCRKIVTAHTLDDQAETVLMRILRGSGLRGLAGIPYKRPEGAFWVVRPLLGCEKETIVRFLKESRIPFCEDRTNKSPLFTRNRIRHELLPQMSRFFNPQVKQSLSNLHVLSQEAWDYLHRQAAAAYRRSCLKKGPSKFVRLSVPRLKALHPALAREVVCQVFMEVKGDLRRLTFTHVAAILKMLQSNALHAEAHLPGRIQVKKQGPGLEFLRMTPLHL
ncbi:MAG: tRNA lysidine(34) synthetase TilS [Candidatus Omnitrophica bacterium]|nr:tRNA lysidine(34) synthetase TilS [Candidatus Omnitrophota bacterium]